MQSMAPCTMPRPRDRGRYKFLFIHIWTIYPAGGWCVLEWFYQNAHMTERVISDDDHRVWSHLPNEEQRPNGFRCWLRQGGLRISHWKEVLWSSSLANRIKAESSKYSPSTNQSFIGAVIPPWAISKCFGTSIVAIVKCTTCPCVPLSRVSRLQSV